ncbi:pantetheine-phosphate adenylyltransferase [Vagococcus lutrae]|uniref:pantetheine-phosphate adenylyltransferase n=1 Tax=Vagococcus lutrae TaxID=81947 RepID=UPI00200DFFE8|nr:pantetheine-phosphate adenylyltransferase [Vagococcus lutrae]UQF71363.1 pantetheine-phosphate adenylyltransferase [Vagococcus lutrae]
MTEKIALFPGSFDPFTLGHLNTVTRAAKMFDKVIVAIVTNTSKRPLFTAKEKKRLAAASIAHLDNVEVILHEEGLTVHIAEKLGAEVLIRGIRNITDYEYEKNIAHMNARLAPNIETLFLLADPAYANISSSVIKEIAKFEGDVSPFVPQSVNEALEKKYRDRHIGC